MLSHQASCQIDHIQYQVPLKLDRITLMWLLVGVCLAILRADGRMNTNHLIGIAHMATDVNRFYAATLVQPQKIPGILFHLGCFPSQRSALWTSFPKATNKWMASDKCRPHPCTCCLGGTRGVLIAAARGRRELSLLTSPATQLKFSHKPKSRVLLPHRHSLCGIPRYWVSSRYNLPTTGRVQI